MSACTQHWNTREGLQGRAACGVVGEDVVVRFTGSAYQVYSHNNRPFMNLIICRGM